MARLNVSTYAVEAHRHASYGTRYMLPLIEFAGLSSTFSSTQVSLRAPAFASHKTLIRVSRAVDRMPNSRERNTRALLFFFGTAAPDPKNPKYLKMRCYKADGYH